MNPVDNSLNLPCRVWTRRFIDDEFVESRGSFWECVHLVINQGHGRIATSDNKTLLSYGFHRYGSRYAATDPQWFHFLRVLKASKESQ